jgi:hypothetical protein
MPRRQQAAGSRPEPGFNRPNGDLVWPRANRKIRATRSRYVRAPVDSEHSPIGPKHGGSGVEHRHRLFHVQDVEKKNCVDTAGGDSKSILDDITHRQVQIAHAGSLGTRSRRLNHCRLDVECMQRASDSTRDGQRKRAVSATDFNGILYFQADPQSIKNSFDIEEALPIALLRHSAITHLHDRIDTALALLFQPSLTPRRRRTGASRVCVNERPRGPALRHLVRSSRKS